MFIFQKERIKGQQTKNINSGLFYRKKNLFEIKNLTHKTDKKKTIGINVLF